jgi:uncharacterized delta-60 repeat protein
MSRFALTVLLVLASATGVFAQIIRLPTSFRVVRVTASGDVDNSFGTSGLGFADVHFDLGAIVAGGRYEVADATLDGSGRIVVVGSYRAPGATNAVLAVWRLTKNGERDASFGSNGLALREFAGHVTARRAVAKSNGVILVAGSSDGGFATACFSSTGARCYQTWEGVTRFSGYTAEGSAIAATTDGGFIVGGTARPSAGGDRRLALAKYTRYGMLDPQFSGDGRLLHQLNSYDEVIHGLAQEADGRIVAVGTSYLQPPGIGGRMFVSRYHGNGIADTSFGFGTGVIHPFIKCAWGVACESSGGLRVVLTGDGRILAGGYAGTPLLKPLVVKLKADGTLDKSFHGSGTLIEHDIDASLVGLSPAGFPGLIRYQQNGERQTAFGDGGVATVPTCYQDPSPVGSAVQWFPVFFGSPPDLRPILVYACYEPFYLQ